MNCFYVYAHTRKDNGAIFYIGKGSGKRAGLVTKRSQYWKNVFSKAGGRDVLFLARGMDEELAFLLEVEAIDKYRRLGVQLVNLTDGGEGASWSDELRERRLSAMRKPASVSAFRSRMSRPVVCENTGRRFPSITGAVDWLRINGWPKAIAGNITLCARGSKRSAYGFRWFYATKD